MANSNRDLEDICEDLQFHLALDENDEDEHEHEQKTDNKTNLLLSRSQTYNKLNHGLADTLQVQAESSSKKPCLKTPANNIHDVQMAKENQAIPIIVSTPSPRRFFQVGFKVDFSRSPSLNAPSSVSASGVPSSFVAQQPGSNLHWALKQQQLLCAKDVSEIKVGKYMNETKNGIEMINRYIESQSNQHSTIASGYEKENSASVANHPR